MPQMVYQLNNLATNTIYNIVTGHSREHQGALLGLSSVSQNKAFTTNGPSFFYWQDGHLQSTQPQQNIPHRPKKLVTFWTHRGGPSNKIPTVSGALLSSKMIMISNVKYVSFKIRYHIYLFSGCDNQRFSFTKINIFQSKLISLPVPPNLFPASIYKKAASIHLSFLSQYRFLNNREGVPQWPTVPALSFCTFISDPRDLFLISGFLDLAIFLCQSYNIQMMSAWQAVYVFILNLLSQTLLRKLLNLPSFPQNLNILQVN